MTVSGVLRDRRGVDREARAPHLGEQLAEIGEVPLDEVRATRSRDHVAERSVDGVGGSARPEGLGGLFEQVAIEIEGGMRLMTLFSAERSGLRMRGRVMH